MIFESEVLDLLNAPIDPTTVKSREGGGGKTLSYVEAHYAIRLMNEIFGQGAWGYRVVSLDCLGEEPAVSKYGKEGFRVAYGAVVEIYIDNGPTFSDTGYGDGVEYTGSRLAPHELARKEAVSDALKRALKNLGDPFGLALYDKGKRADVERRRKVGASVPAMKREVMKLAEERLGHKPETGAEVAALFGVEVTDLTDEVALRRILTKAKVL